MSDFNYEQFPTEVLEAEKVRVEETMAILENKHRLIEVAIGNKAIEGTNNDQVL
jgi:hypothetical protein